MNCLTCNTALRLKEVIKNDETIVSDTVRKFAVECNLVCDKCSAVYKYNADITSEISSI